MKSFCTTGLVLFASLGWAVSAAHAQGGAFGTPSLLPLPAASPILSGPVTASYTSDGASPLSALTAQPTVPSSQGDQLGQSPFEGALHGPDSGDGSCCDTAACNSGCCGGRWFGAIGGLAMGRNRANPFWTTYQTNNNVNQLMNTQNAGANWAGGGQITAGYAFCGCGCMPGPALAFTYWGVSPMTGSSTITDSNNLLSTPIDLTTQFGNVMIGPNAASAYFDNAHEQRITRDDRVNNFELNLLQPIVTNTGRFQFAPLAGFRYFRFDERLDYSSVSAGHNFGDDGGADQATLGFRCVNNLYGGQVGAFMNYMLTQRFGVFVIPKVGIFANQMNCQAQLYSGDGLQGFNLGAHKTDAAFLGEVDTGLSFAFTPSLRAYIGYRLIGVSGLALADNQFLPFLADQQGFQQVKQNGAIILQGGFGGLSWVF